jgi:AraC-like DNA-binding protein
VTATDQHLELTRLVIVPSDEWIKPISGWAFFLVESGYGYWRGFKGAKELAAGDLIAVSGYRPGTFLASQLGQLQLRYFVVNLHLLGGILTVAEQRRLVDLLEQENSLEGHYSGSHPMAEALVRLSSQVEALKRFEVCCRLLAYFAEFVRDFLPEAADREKPPKTCQDRFSQLVSKLPVAELLSRETGELARACACSPRHFNRLFRGHFGVSVRAKQVELRLQKAQRLLRESDNKIIDIALESGYHHLGLFNSVFKRKFGLTPSKWRQRNRIEARGELIGSRGRLNPKINSPRTAGS